MKRFHLTKTQKLIATGVAVVAAAALAGGGVLATFTATDSVTQGQITTGTVNIDASGVGTFSTPLPDVLAAGDTVERFVDLTTTSTLALSTVKLSTSASGTGVAELFDGTVGTAAENQLQLEVLDCQGGTWSGAPGAYACSGTSSSVYSGAVKTTGSTLAALDILTTAGPNVDHLKLKLTLPSTAGNTPVNNTVVQGKTLTVTYTFDATQRAAQNF